MVKGLEAEPYEAEVTWSIQAGEESEERLHCSYNFLLRGSGGEDTDLSSLVIMKLCQEK